MKKHHKLFSSGLVWIWIAVLIIGFDRFSKIWALKHLIFAEPLSLLPFFNLTLLFNKGAAFSFLNHAAGWQHFVLGGLAIVVSMGIIVWLKSLPARAVWMNIALNFILGGALGNAWDRALYGYVVDYFDFHLGDWHFAIFNFADSAICIGAFMLIVSWFRQEKK